jgi:hypothetical protein
VYAARAFDPDAPPPNDSLQLTSDLRIAAAAPPLLFASLAAELWRYAAAPSVKAQFYVIR